MKRDLRPVARFVLWDYERGSWAYGLMWLAILLFVFLVRGSWLGDPMVPR